MGSTFPIPPSKRTMPDPTNCNFSNGPSSSFSSSSSFKRPKPPQPPLYVPPAHVAFRLLCHASRVGGIIGKSGSIIKQLSLSTGAKIRIEDAPPDSPDRVVTVMAPAAVSTLIPLGFKIEYGQNNGSGDGDQIEVSKAQEALIRVFDRILEVASESNGGSVGVGIVSCRLLAEKNQVGSIIGKGGKVVEKIRRDSGCRIRVLSDKLPACADPSDEMVEIEGDVAGVKKALIAISFCLQDFVQSEKAKISGTRNPETMVHQTSSNFHVDPLPQRNTALSATPSNSIGFAPGTYSSPIDVDSVPSTEAKAIYQEVSYRILCSNDRVGGVIGKGGAIVKALQNESGALISVGPSLSDCDDRLITITASENAESPYSPAQKAVILVFARSIDAGIAKGIDSGSSKGSPVTARLVVPSNQVGCLLGKGGCIVSEIRKATGTSIRIVANDIPKCALENDEVVQISGEFSNVQEALYNVLGRLRDNILPSTSNTIGSRNTSSLVETSTYENLRDPSASGLMSSLGASSNLSRQSSMAGSMDNLMRLQNLDHSPSPRLWESKVSTGVTQRGITDISRGLTSFRGGVELGSGSKSAIVTNTTVEIVVPENVIHSVYGENGSNLSKLRQISGAKVIVHEPLRGKSERVVVISGTPEETQAAQSLLHAFILTGS